MTDEQRRTLVATIQNLRNRLLRIQQRGEAVGEQDTKRVFITPLLRALGWDVEDLEEVRNEYRHRPQDNPVDYALFMMRTPCLFVEAKGLNSSLSDRKWVSQMIGYAATVGVEWCVLTNGDEYRLYNAHAPVDADEKLFRTIRLSDESVHDLAVDTLDLLTRNKMGENRLSALWKAHFVDRRVKAAMESLLRSQDDSLVRLVHKRTIGLTSGDIKNSLKRADMHLNFPVLAGVESAPPEPASRARPEKPAKAERGPTLVPGTLKELIEARLIKPPLDLTATWKKQPFTARVHEDGSITFDGAKYASLSVAAGMARNVANGKPPDGRPYWQTNGWAFWRFQDDESGASLPMDALRQRFNAKRG